MKPKLEVNWDDISLAMTGPSEMEAVLDLKTGEVRWVDIEEISGEPDLSSEEIDAEAERYVSIERPPSREAYSWMERFAEGVKDGRLRDRLLWSLSNRKPFRNFKNVLLEHPEVLGEWHAFNDAREKEYLWEWARGLPVEITNPPK